MSTGISVVELLVGAHDLLIAATAIAHGYAVLTHSLRDFQPIPGLTLQQPDWQTG